MAEKNSIRSIAFPAISTGVYRFPVERASEIAVKTVLSFLLEHPDIEKVVFVCFNSSIYEVYDKLIDWEITDIIK